MTRGTSGSAGYFSLHSLRGRLLLFATVLASGMAFLAASMVVIALPRIQSAFDAVISDVQWVANAPYIALAAFILIGGALGDRFGRRRIFLLGITIFTFASLLAVFTPSITFLIGVQGLIGLGAALMIPGSLALINSCFLKEFRGRAIGHWAGFSGGIAAFAPLIGGWLVETFGWQAVFAVNVPLGLAVFAAVFLFVPESRDPEPRRIDWPGTLLIILALLGVSFGLVQGPDTGWTSPYVLGSLIGGAVALALFVIIERRVQAPAVPLALFRNRLVAGANLATLFLYFALSGFVFFFSLNLQQIQGYSPTEAGLAIVPAFVLIAVLSGLGGTLADRLGPRIQMILGPVLVGSAMLLLSSSGLAASYVTAYLPAVLLFGFGMAITIAPLTKSALAVPDRYSGLASGVNNAISRFASLLAIAVLGAVMVPLFTMYYTAQLDAAPFSQSERQTLRAEQEKLGGITAPDDFSEEKQDITGQIVRTSFITGFQSVMLINALFAFLAAFVAFFFVRRPSSKRREHHEFFH